MQYIYMYIYEIHSAYRYQCQGHAARMLLRSTSSPLVNSWLPSSSSSSCPCSLKEAHHESVGVSAEVVAIPRAPRRPVMTHALSDSDLTVLSAPGATVSKRRPSTASRKDKAGSRQTHDQDITRCIAGKRPRSSLLLSSSGLVNATSFPSFKSGVRHDSILSNDFAGEGGGGSGHGYLGFSAERNEDENGKEDGSTTDAYYQKMIQANPGNSLVAGNYAKFLEEVRGDSVKAQEYCERALMGNPRDATILALYADLIWQSNKDAQRAELYFDQAVQAAPQDCYIMASHARFLWDTEEDVGEPEDVESKRAPPPLHPEAASPSIAATF
ncbi:putative tetratricopeptide-like helical domain superfamily [Dioscorea sansibarensis]